MIGAFAFRREADLSPGEFGAIVAMNVLNVTLSLVTALRLGFRLEVNDPVSTQVSSPKKDQRESRA